MDIDKQRGKSAPGEPCEVFRGDCGAGLLAKLFERHRMYGAQFGKPRAEAAAVDHESFVSRRQHIRYCSFHGCGAGAGYEYCA